jgi:flagellar biosynthesis GTPase FlhF
VVAAVCGCLTTSSNCAEPVRGTRGADSAAMTSVVLQVKRKAGRAKKKEQNKRKREKVAAKKAKAAATKAKAQAKKKKAKEEEESSEEDDSEEEEESSEEDESEEEEEEEEVKPKKKKAKAAAVDSDDDDEPIGSIRKPKITDAILKQKLEEYSQGPEFETLSLKMIRAKLQEDLGQDMTEYKPKIKEIITTMLT